MEYVEIDGQSYELESVLPPKVTDAGKLVDTRWKITVNGTDFTDEVDTLAVVNHGMGLGFLYGKSPAGPYNQGRLVNRGGAVIVPTVKVDGEVYFLALEQVRPFVGPEPILEFPRGQALSGEKTVDTAARELLEETGLPLDEDSLVHLGNGNPDSALVHGANVHTWWLQLPEEFVNFDENGMPVLRPDLEANPESKLIESIKKAVFVEASDFESESHMTSNAAGLVFRELYLAERKI
jgi:8-oxo-dGTP pyrophosphatase MutT (NUDIX family)